MARNAPGTGITILSDRYGRRSTQSAQFISERKMRKWTAARQKAIHRAKNGVNDVYTYFHLVEELTSLKPWQSFTSAQLADWLNGTRPQFIWDAVTIGRILNDLIESWNESNPGDTNQPLTVKRTWSGTIYETTDYQPARAVLFSLLDDLAGEVDRLYDTELQGLIRPRLSSPLSRCPSIIAEELAM